MKNINYITLAFITLAYSLCSCAVQSEYCDDKHPHIDKLIINAKWNDIQKTSTTPPALQLYCWESNATHPTIKETTADESGRFFFDLPKPGNYNMLLVGKLQDDYFYLNDQKSYDQFNGLIALSPKLTNALYVQDLGNIIIKDNSSLFLDAEICKYSRNMNINVIIDDMVEQPAKAHINFSGFSKGVNMYDQQYFGSYNLELPLTVNNNNLQTSVSYLKSDGTNNIFTLSITSPKGEVVTHSIDFTKSLQDFELSHPFANDINIEVGVLYTRSNNVFDFVIQYISIDGKDVYRFINA